MQYGVYSIFRSWWVGRKEELERVVKRWNIVIAKVCMHESSSARDTQSITCRYIKHWVDNTIEKAGGPHVVLLFPWDSGLFASPRTFVDSSRKSNAPWTLAVYPRHC